MSDIRGGGREYQPVTVQERREELPCVRGWGSGREELPRVQGQERWRQGGDTTRPHARGQGPRPGRATIRPRPGQ